MAEEQEKINRKFVGDEDEARAILKYHRKLRQATSQAPNASQKDDDGKDEVKDHA